VAREPKEPRESAKSKSEAQVGEHASGEPSIIVYGDFPQRVVHIPRTLSSLLFAVGHLEGTEESATVLVPFIELKFGSDSEDDGQADGDAGPLFSQVLQIENAAFIIFDMARDFKIACEQLLSMAGSDLRPHLSQIEPVSGYISRARAEIDQCLAELNKLVEKLASKT
jgi:hypothetical protein